jgi:hypothetical protein
MVYHVSNIHGLKTLEPRVSTHGKAYVYALEDMMTGLLFGVRQDDFDFIISTTDEGQTEIYECYPNALEIKYKNQSCSVYELEETGFMRGQTSWSAELVSEKSVSIVNEFIINNIYDKLIEEDGKGKLIMYRYENKSDYKAMISRHIVDRLIRFNALRAIETDERFKKHYSKLISVLEDAMSGKYL